ncbi:MAG: glycoside hydrolase family 3 C-terminal domain-containing protein, partial [Tannerella sp.]|nr:glycoside hydrolase family 3 C-terminal domain-containing protein [Tannerella sp.]
PAVPRLGIPAYDWWNECLHGVARAGKATVFPKPVGLGSLWDADLVKRITTAVSDEARAKYHKVLREKGYSPRYEGLTFFSPTLNIARDPRWGRTSECFSEDPYLTAETGAAFIRGLQGDDPDYLKLVATPKHFAANNEENRRRDGSSDVDERSLREYCFPAFRTGIEKAKATSVMGAYNALNGVPCCANPFLLTQVLRDEWRFDGVVISDGTAIRRISSDHKYLPSYEEGAAAALKAGCDMSLGDEYRDGLRYAFRMGLVSKDDINRAVDRVLTLRFRLGMFDAQEKVPYSTIPYSVVECEAHRQLALEAARKSIVLLKNDGILPVNTAKTKKIALIGEAFQRIYYGDYSGQPEHSRTLLEALKTAWPDAELTWVSDVEKEETIPSAHLMRPEKDAYDGRLGFSGEYFDEAGAVIHKHDLTLDFKPAYDYDLSRTQQLSARWTSTLLPPLTGEYRLFYEGGGTVTIFIDGKEMIHKKVGDGSRAEVNVTLEAGRKYGLRVECTGMNRYVNHRLAWQPPFDPDRLTPETAARQADIVLVFIRDVGGMEGRDRRTLALAPQQEELVRRVAKHNPNTVLILGSGTPLLLGNVSKQVRALLNIWIAGQGEAQAIADLLSGEVNPSGKTPVTFFADETQLPALDDYDVQNGRSYQYFKGTVLYPFGFGLSYNKYTYARPQLKQSNVARDGTVSVSVKIRNKGKYDGEEIVQCYVSSDAWEAEGLTRKLVAFDRIALKKGGTGTVEFHIPVEELSRWNVDKDRWEVRPGTYRLSVAPHSGVENAIVFTVL